MPYLMEYIISNNKIDRWFKIPNKRTFTNRQGNREIDG